MKRMIRALLAAAVLVSSLTVSAFAATDGFTTDVDGTVTCADGKYTASYTGAEAGEQYVLLVVEGTPESYSVSQDSILYINQVAADANGVVTFSDFIPMNVANSVVLLGGYFSDGSPKVLGTILSQYTLGDVDDNGEITADDALQALQIALGITAPTDTQFKAADADASGDITADDALLVLQYALGIIDEF